MRRLLGTGAAIALAAIAAPAAQAGPVTPVPGLPADALTVMNQPAYASAQWFVSVRDLATGASVVSLKANELAEPGSVVKTYSMGAGWQHFGPDSRVVTPVKRTGTMSGGTLDGNLILVAQGDMTMDGRTKPDGTVDFANLDHNDANLLPGATLTPENPLTGLNKLAAAGAASGIVAVSGERDRRRPAVGDVPARRRADHPDRHQPEPHRLHHEARRPGQTASTRCSPKVAPWKVTSEVETVAAGKPSQIKVSSPAYGKVVLSGTIAADADPAINTYAFADPARYARTAFIEALSGPA